MDNHHHHHHIRYPPPPSHGDHHHHQQPFFPPPPNNNNQYHNYQQQQWQQPHAPPPPPPQYNSYPPPPPQQHHNQGPYYNQQGPPPPNNQPYSHPSPHPQPYYNNNQQQQWGNQQSWGHQQQQPQHQAGGIIHNNEEDWGARAKAWASASASIKSQHPQSQFSSAVRQEERPHAYYDQYQQAADPHYTNRYQESQSLLGHQQVSVTVGNHQQDFVASSSGPSSSYVADAQKSSSNHVFSQANISTTSVYQQEIPSSYSSFPGKEETCDRNEQLNRQSYLPTLPQVRQHSVQPTPPFPDRSAPVEQNHFTRGNQSEAIPDLSNQPLEFVQPQPQLNYSLLNLAGPAGSTSALATVQGNAYSPVPSVMQFDQSFGTISMPGLAVSTYGNGPNFHPTGSVGASSFNIAGTSLNPGFPGDTNGVPNFSDRPRKAPVPNWLREEIIKKTVLTTSSHEISDENLNKPIYDDGVDKSFNKGDQEDSKDIDSSKSSEHKEDDEDHVDAEKAAAVNKELKRLLTQILSKVTDQLFDEIADRVVNEDNSAIKGNKNFIPSNREATSSLPARSTPTISATVLLPTKTMETEANESSSILHSSLSGLLSYASDDDEDNDEDESRSSIISISRKTSGDNQDICNKISDHTPIDNGVSHRHSSVKNGSNDNKVNMKMDLEDENISSSHSWHYGTNGIEVTDLRVSKSSMMEKTSDKSNLAHSVTSAKNLMFDESKKSSAGNTSVGDGEASKLKTDIKSGTRERMYDRDIKSSEKTMKLDSRKSSDSKDNHREMEKVRKATEYEDNRRNREAGRDEKGRSRHGSVKDPSRHRRCRSSSRDRRRKDNSRSHDHSSDETSEDSRKRKPRSRNRSPSPSPSHSKRRHSQRRHSPYSSHETTRRSKSKSPVKRRSRSKSPVRRRRS